MICHKCREKHNTDQLPNFDENQVAANQGPRDCRVCRRYVNHVGIAVIPRGKQPMTRKERILNRRGRRVLLLM